MNKTNDYGYSRFDMKMTDQEREALEKLAQREGVTMSRWVKNAIIRTAKRKKIWP